MIVFFSTFKDLKEINIHTITVNVVSVPIKYSQSYFGVFWFGVVLGFFFCLFALFSGEIVFKAERKLVLPTQIRQGPTDDFELNLNG